MKKKYAINKLSLSNSKIADIYYIINITQTIRHYCFFLQDRYHLDVGSVVYTIRCIYTARVAVLIHDTNSLG